MEIYLLFALVLVIACALSILLTKSLMAKKIQLIKDATQMQLTNLEKEFIEYKAVSESNLKMAALTEIRLQTNVERANLLLEEKQKENELLQQNSSNALAELNAKKSALIEKQNELLRLKEELTTLRIEWERNNRQLATVTADNNALQYKLQTQKQEIEELNRKFTTEFENIANKILDTKSQKFTDLNKENIKGLLEPLGLNIAEFKKQVNEVYASESKERFSLGEEIKRLSELNQLLGKEAKNLATALKGEAKTQGRWGEVILENILDKSGLRKGEEYFMEYQLFDAEGKALRSEAEGKKMRPDALVMYPDNRHIIIDSKVSLNAFVRFIESEDSELQKMELDAHILALKAHINELSKKAYDDYDKTLDFVMMFIPNEPAYMTAMQGEPDLWNYAYERRILLISPTNLIASLKLMVDLWKREYQNQNAQAIAERGAKMYDKFVGFIENLEAVGVHLGRAQDKYGEAFKQLNAGNDNLVSQATKLKALGIKNKKDLPSGMSELAIQNDLE